MNPYVAPFVLLALIAVLTYGALRVVVLPLIHRATTRTATKWDDILADRPVLNRLSLIAPLVVVRGGLSSAVMSSRITSPTWLDLGQRLTDALLIVALIYASSAVSASVETIYATFERSHERPIKGYLQVMMIALWVLGAILVVARLADQPVGFFLGGLGALSAVVILVFRDTILSVVASVQLSNNDMLRIGDWIEMPSQGADGDVVDMALHTIKVQNFDKTITTVPTYKLISDSFKNWRGMTDDGARRIKRSILLDLGSVRFLTEDEVERWSRFAPLVEYMAAKRSELAEWNASLAAGAETVADMRRLTNVGTFRAYVMAYLGAHPDFETENHTMLVRQLQPDARGLPLEVYAFADTTDWGRFEAIQADLFDHLLALVGEFGLRVFQSPAGSDISAGAR